MDGPDFSPLLARAAGPDFADGLKSRLLALADEAEDPAYASRLRAVARGDRPLRTLALDPAWNRQFAPQIEQLSTLPELTGKEAEDFRLEVQHAASTVEGFSVTPEQAAAESREALARATRAREIARQDELAGWATVHEEPEDGADGKSA